MASTSSGRCLIVALLALCPRDAGACAVVSVTPSGPAPHVNAERALIVWDRETRKEHLILELELADAAGKFGLLIPTPSKPEIAAVEKSPFGTLAAYPFTGGAIASKSVADAAKPIEIYSEQRIGNFTATMLAARDQDALAGWLADNGMEAAPTTSEWRARYLRLGFFFVALRYDAADNKDPRMTSQTMRLTFDAPAPFYPYVEPPVSSGELRRLSLWLITRDEPLVPVAARGMSFIRPLREGERYRHFRGHVERAVLDASILPPGNDLNVQTFEDRKSAREGISDLVFVPEKPRPPSEDDRVLSTWLDPRLREVEAPPAVIAAPAPSVPTTAVTTSSGGCAVARGAPGPWLLIAIAAGARWLAALLALGCRKEPAPPPPRPAPSVTPSASTAAMADRLREVSEIVRGVVPSAGIPVVALDPNAQWDPPRRIPSIKLDAVAEGSVTREIAIRIARASAPRFRACYELGLRTMPALEGRVSAFLTIASNGQTERAKLTDTLPHAPTVACFASVFQSLVFPPATPPAPASATIELDLSSTSP